MTSQRNYPKRSIVGQRRNESLNVLVDVLECGHEVIARRDYKGAETAERRACGSCAVAKFSRAVASL